MNIDSDALRKVMDDLQGHAKDMHDKMMNLIDVGKKLEEDYDRIMRKGHLTEALLHQVISNYKKSPKLTEDIVRQFGEGYQDAKMRIKAKMHVVGLDPKIFDSFDEEDEVEEPSPST